ncbi:unnamed protein product [Ascophyllum nodosum]
MAETSGAKRKEIVIPPFRFGTVEADVFRSAQPTLKNFRFLARLKLRTVVSIAPEGPMEDEAMFCRSHGAQLLSIRAELFRDEAITVTSHQVAQVLSVLVDADRLPALVHCPDGRVLAGLVVWCLRRLQCWDGHASAAEFSRFCGVLPSRDVKKFVDGFRDEITVPENVPRWLWGGDRAHWHPTIRIRHKPPLEVIRTEPLPSQKTLSGAGRRRSLHERTRSLVGRDGFARDVNDGDAMLDEEPHVLSRTVQALSLEGLDMTSPDIAAYG